MNHTSFAHHTEEDSTLIESFALPDYPDNVTRHVLGIIGSVDDSESGSLTLSVNEQTTRILQKKGVSIERYIRSRLRDYLSGELLRAVLKKNHISVDIEVTNIKEDMYGSDVLMRIEDGPREYIDFTTDPTAYQKKITSHRFDHWEHGRRKSGKYIVLIPQYLIVGIERWLRNGHQESIQSSIEYNLNKWSDRWLEIKIFNARYFKDLKHNEIRIVLEKDPRLIAEK